MVADKKSAAWKVMITYYMKKHTLVSNSWLSEHLYMGRSQGVSQYVGAFEKAKGFKFRPCKQVTGKFDSTEKPIKNRHNIFVFDSANACHKGFISGFNI